MCITASEIRKSGDYPDLFQIPQLSRRARRICDRKPELIADMNRIKYSFNPYNVNRLSILAGAAAMRDWDYTKECTGRICKTREKTTEALRALGFTVLDSKTNFIFAKSGDMPGKVYFDGLREAGILVRRWDSERIKDYVRISIGSEEEMETFVEETKKLVEAARSAVVR